MVGGGGELVVRYGTSMVGRVMVIAALVASFAQKSTQYLRRTVSSSTVVIRYEIESSKQLLCPRQVYSNFANDVLMFYVRKSARYCCVFVYMYHNTGGGSSHVAPIK